MGGDWDGAGGMSSRGEERQRHSPVREPRGGWWRRVELARGGTAPGDGGRLIVLGAQDALVQLVLREVRLGRRFDVHEGDRGAQAAGAVVAVLLVPRQQLDALDAAIAANTHPYVSALPMRSHFLR